MITACQQPLRCPSTTRLIIGVLAAVLSLAWLGERRIDARAAGSVASPDAAPSRVGSAGSDAVARPFENESLGDRAHASDPVMSDLLAPESISVPDQQFRAWQVFERCGDDWLAGAFARSDQPGVARAQERALEQRLAWCEEALGAMALARSVEDPNRLAQVAFLDGSLLAEAHALHSLAVQHGESYAETLAREFLRTAEPEFLLAVSRYVADRPEGYAPRVAGLDLHLMDIERRTELFELSVQSLACGYGQDCTQRGLLMQDYCVVLGICYATFDDALERELLSPRDHQRMLRLRDALHEGIRNGDFSAFGL